MKTTPLILLLTTAGLWAQSPESPPAFPAFPTNAAVNTNRQQALQRALQRALESKTNAALLGASNTLAKPMTVGQAGRIEGVTPAAMLLLLRIARQTAPMPA